MVDFALGNMSPEESLEVLEYLEQHPDASKDLDLASGLLNFVALHAEDVFEANNESVVAKRSVGRNIAEWLEGIFRSRRLVYSIAVVFLAIVGLVAASWLNTSKYYGLTKMDGLPFESIVRGPGEQDFVIAQQLFSEKRYDESIRQLERFLKAFPRSELADYAHYSAGAVCLVGSQRSVVLLFPSHDPAHVRQGLNHLDIAVHTSSNVRIIEESHWLRAKGFLMLDMPEEAIAELGKVESLDGVRKADAFHLAATIKEIKKRG